jgi:TRAP-type C4-dicarboxylate transport system permease small subunit
MRKLLDRSENVLTNLAAVSTFIMMCLTTIDAVGRYIFNRPISGAYEITERYLAVATVFLGICYAYRGGAYIRVSFFVDRMPPTVKLALNYFVQVFSILLSLAFLIATAYQAYRKFSSGITLGFLPFPIWPAYGLVSVGFFFTTLLMILDLWRIKKGESDLFKEESPTA